MFLIIKLILCLVGKGLFQDAQMTSCQKHFYSLRPINKLLLPSTKFNSGVKLMSNNDRTASANKELMLSVAKTLLFEQLKQGVRQEVVCQIFFLF